MENQSLKIEKNEGDPGYVNKNCWLARNLNYPPSKRCQYCELKFNNCLFEHYLVISLILAFSLLFLSYLVEKNISKSLIVSIFVLIITYGYFFNKSTEKIIISNFKEKKAKNSFKELSGTLQQKVDEQTKDIKGQKEKVEKAYEVEKEAHNELKKLDEAKTNFMLVTQHHLRTPLTGTRGFLDLVLAGAYGKISKKVSEAINKAVNGVDKEIAVVDDLISVSTFQLGDGAVHRDQNVSIKKMLEEIISDLRPIADKKNIYLKLENTDKENIPEILVDQKQIRMALQNIIDNAIKYTKQGGINIKIKTEYDKIKIEVKDTGIGMEQDDRKYLFEKPFQRSKEAWSQNATGKGIGVYLSAQIIKAHNGRIWVESAGRGKGSTFFVELPVQQK